MSAAGIMAGGAFVTISAIDKTGKVFLGIQKGMQSLGQKATVAGGIVSAAGLSIVGGLAGAVKVFADMGSAMDDASQRTGVSVEALSELNYAAKMSGAGAADVEAALRRMGMTLADAAAGSDSANAALGGLGLSLADLQGLSPEKQLAAIADGVAGIQDPAKRAAAVVDVLGKSSANLVPMLSGGAKGLAEAAAEARKFGLVLSGSAAKDAAALGDSWDQVVMQGSALMFTIGSALAPAIMDLLAAIKPAVGAAIDFVNSNKELVVTVAKVGVGLLAAGGALVAIGTTVSVVGGAFGAIGSALVAIATPAGLAVAAIGGIAAALVYAHVEGDTFGEKMTNIWTSLVAGAGMAFDFLLGVAAGVVVAFQHWQEVIGLLPQVFDAGLTLAFGTVEWLWGNLKIFGDWLSKEWVNIFANTFSNISTLMSNWAGMMTAFYSALWEKIMNPEKEFNFDFSKIGDGLTKGLKPLAGTLPAFVGKELNDAEKAALERLNKKAAPLVGEAADLAKQWKDGLFGGFGQDLVEKADAEVGGPGKKPDPRWEKADVAGTFSAAAIQAGALAGDTISKQQLDVAKQGNAKLDKIQKAIEANDPRFND